MTEHNQTGRRSARGLAEASVRFPELRPPRASPSAYDDGLQADYEQRVAEALAEHGVAQLLRTDTMRRAMQQPDTSKFG